MNYFFCARVDDFVAPDEALFDGAGKVYGDETDQIVKGIDRFVPGAHRNASAPAGDPFLSVGHPEQQAAVGFQIPFPVSRIVKHGIRCFGGFAKGDGIGRTIGGTIFTSHAEIMGIERNRFVHLKGHIGRNRL